MLITTTALAALRTGFSLKFNAAFDEVKSLRDRVAETIPSTDGENLYGWLGELPGMREWLGARVIHGLKDHDYRIVNKDFELTISIPRNHILDDKLGTYGTRFAAMGRATGRHPEQLVWETLLAGFASPCYDGQPFFDTDHPVIGEDGEIITVANTDGGSGAPWFLMCTNEVIKPIIFQERQKAQFVSLDKPTDENVFMNKTYIYGSESRCGAGYGFWQQAWGSKQDFNAANYETARTALQSMKADYGRPLGMSPNLLVVGPSNESAALKLINSELAAGGETNQWKGTAEVLVVPWLA